MGYRKECLRSREKDRVREFSETLDQVSPSFCLAKWQQVTLHLYKGHTQSCHHVPSHAIGLKQGQIQLHNTSEKIRARRQMLAGQRPKECEYCWRIEDRGQLSDRTYKSQTPWALPYFAQAQTVEWLNEARPSYLEVAFDNTCNFKCMYCSPAYSSSWEQEMKQHGPYPTTGHYVERLKPKSWFERRLSEDEKAHYLNAFWDWFPSIQQDLQQLRVTGGEPLLSKETWRLIDYLKQNPHPNLDFAINSNLGIGQTSTERLAQAVNQLQGCIKYFTLFCSIDTWGEQAEFIRTGLDAKAFWHNFELLAQEIKQPMKFSFMITVNALSLFQLRQLMEQIAHYRKTGSHHEIAFDTPYLKNPRHLGIQILPPEFSSYLKDTIEFMQGSNLFSWEERAKLERLLPLIENKESRSFALKVARWDFYRTMQEHEKRRKLNFLKIFPEFAQVWPQWSRLFG
jgi:organic radical activating enzyme